MGVVYYGNYLAFFESGRVEALRAVGAAYGRLVASGVHSPVIQACVRYRQPARFDDVLLVSAHTDEIGLARFAFEYQVHRESDGVLVATGRTVHACVDADTLRPVRLPAWVVEALRHLQPTT
jgi:acyl-CoA thioester hydrolase